jgi:hypothetical protein
MKMKKTVIVKRRKWTIDQCNENEIVCINNGNGNETKD